MKYKAFFLAASVLLLISCNSADKQQRAVAESFLGFYFATEYDSAATLCTPELGEELLNSLKSINSLEDGVKEMIAKQTSGIKTQIVSLEKSSSKDSVLLKYKVILPNFPNGIDNRMVLVKEGKSWLVAGFGQ
jgi:hypothetical protein